MINTDTQRTDTARLDWLMAHLRNVIGLDAFTTREAIDAHFEKRQAEMAREADANIRELWGLKP